MDVDNVAMLNVEAADLLHMVHNETKAVFPKQRALFDLKFRNGSGKRALFLSSPMAMAVVVDHHSRFYQHFGLTDRPNSQLVVYLKEAIYLVHAERYFENSAEPSVQGFYSALNEMFEPFSLPPALLKDLGMAKDYVKKIRLPRITTTPPQHYPFPFKRRQYPIRPCFAMTINKSQGGTFDVEGLDASSPVFSHGQAYVALSRVRDFNKITVLTPNEETTIQNIVFPQVFDKEYIDTQIRQRNERPILPDRMDTEYDHMPPDNQNPFFDDELEAFNDRYDNMEDYDPYDGVNDDSCLGAFMNDEVAFEEDWIPTDHLDDMI